MTKLSKKSPDHKLPRLSRRDWDALGWLMLPVHLGGKITLGAKTADRLVAYGYVEVFEKLIYGSGSGLINRIPVKVSGYRLTLKGNVAYCEWASRQPPSEDEA